MSTSWHASAHQYPADNSNSMVDDEFDMLGTRSRSPMMSSANIPPHSQLAAGMLDKGSHT